MIKELRRSLRHSTTAYDAELARLVEAGAADLNVVLRSPIEGIGFSVASDGTVTDNCTLDDPLLIDAIFTYVKAHFGEPTNYANLKASYDEQKAQLLTKSGYGLEGEPDAES